MFHTTPGGNISHPMVVSQLPMGMSVYNPSLANRSMMMNGSRPKGASMMTKQIGQPKSSTMGGEKNEFHLFLTEHALAPISAKHDFVYKWDFLEKRYKCDAEHRLLTTKADKLPRDELIQFMRNLHSIKNCDPKDKEKACIVYWIVGLTLGFFVLAIISFASSSSSWFRTMLFILMVLVFAAIGYWGYKLVFAKRNHNKKLILRRRKLREYLQKCNMMIESRGLHWTPSPRLSYIVLRTNYKPLGRDLEDYRA